MCGCELIVMCREGSRWGKFDRQSNPAVTAEVTVEAESER